MNSTVSPGDSVPSWVQRSGNTTLPPGMIVFVPASEVTEPLGVPLTLTTPAMLERLVPLFVEGREYAANSIQLPPNLELMAVGGAETIIFDEVIAGRAEELPARLPDILFTVLAPYIGPEAAAAEVRPAGNRT